MDTIVVITIWRAISELRSYLLNIYLSYSSDCKATCNEYVCEGAVVYFH
jgi:hypothetical protein